MMAYKNELYNHIYKWLIEQDTQYLLLEMIWAALSKDTFKLPQEYTNFRGSMRQKILKLSQWQVMQGFSTKGMMHKQHEYHVHTTSEKQGIVWGTILCKNTNIGYTFIMNIKRNSFEYDRQIHGLAKVSDVRLKIVIKKYINYNKTTSKYQTNIYSTNWY